MDDILEAAEPRLPYQWTALSYANIERDEDGLQSTIAHYTCACVLAEDRSNHPRYREIAVH